MERRSGRRRTTNAGDPCIPRRWRSFEITYRHGRTLYRITVENLRGVCRGVSLISLDGAALAPGALIPLSDDGREHQVDVVLGSLATPGSAVGTTVDGTAPAGTKMAP